MQRWQSAKAIGRMPYRTKDALTTAEAFSRSIRCIHSSQQSHADEPRAQPRTQRQIQKSAMSEMSQMPRTQPREVIRRIPADAPSTRGDPRRAPPGGAREVRRTAPNGARGGNNARGGMQGRGGRGRGVGRGGRGGGRQADTGARRARRPQRARGARRTGSDGARESRSAEQALLEDPDNWPMDEYVDEFYEDHFATDVERAEYHDFSRTIEHLELEWAAANRAISEAQASNDTNALQSAKQWWAYIDEQLHAALRQLQTIDDTTHPPHTPTSIDQHAFYQERGVGNVAAGSGKAGNVIEDALRHLGAREGHHWRDPVELAQRVIAGDFVQFLSKVERRAVMLRVWNFPGSRPAGRNDAGKLAHLHFGNMALDADARREVVRRILAGNIHDPQDDALQSEAEREAARITAGRFTGRAKHTLLETIREHLPKSSPKQKQKQKQAA